MPAPGDRNLDTICAISTPHGVGGLSVIRLSGPGAFVIGRKIAPFLPEGIESHRIYFGILKTTSSAGAIDIDEVLVSYFQEGRSFTGEETLEFSCHGSPAISQMILNELTQAGARIADRGEFTYRAFMNGKLDLIQAEGVLALIESQSQRSAGQALRQLRGALSRRLEKIENELTWCLAHLEAGIDFSQEGLELVSSSQLNNRLTAVQSDIKKLIGTFNSGRLLRDGLRVVFLGAPNVGKSSLLNLLLEEDRAIVTDIPGTTRDLIEGSVLINGVKVSFIDTAGLRQASDVIEKIGIQKSYQSGTEADVIFFVFDASKVISQEEIRFLEKIDRSRTYLIGNKKDLVAIPENQQRDELADFKERFLLVSAHSKEDKTRLENILMKHVENFCLEDDATLSQARQFEKMTQCQENLERARQLVQAGVSPEFIALELKEALIKTQETLGKRFDDQILDQVFREFCIGK